MSLITRCPACGTMFKVVPDQLRISEGWVRCGHCTDVFDASVNLQVEGKGADADAPASLSDGRQGLADTNQGNRQGDSLAAPQVLSSRGNTDTEDGVSLQTPDPVLLPEATQARAAHSLESPFELRREDVGAVSEPSLLQVERAQRAEPRPEPEPESGSDTEPELHDLTFMRQGRRAAFWRRPLLRASLLLAVLTLALGLLLQIAVHDRDRLAAANPALRPVLASLCATLDCAIGPPRQIEAIAIDGSSFNKLHGEGYRLDVTIRNQAAMDVAMPALELTLTDGQDQPLVRRVLLPAELGPHPGVIGASSEWTASLALSVGANDAGNRIAGYRLLAFYP